jgi:hypothetical protein
MQQIGEGTLDVPDTWHNQSINVFTAQAPGAPGLSITINRDRLAFQSTLTDYAQAQSTKLAQQLKGYELIEQLELELDGRPAHQYEFAWHTDDMGPVHQIVLCVAEGQAVLNMAATFGGRMSEAQAAHAKRVLHSFKFNPPANPVEEEPPQS